MQELNCQVYFQRAWSETEETEITDDIPQDLCSKEDQYKICEMVPSVLWIRTWYGNEVYDGTEDTLNVATCLAADAGYLRLWRKVFFDDADEVPCCISSD